MGLSTSSLFAYRNGTQPISGKAWSKLEQAEGAATSVAEEKKQEPRTSLKSPYDQYLEFIRACRHEAMTLAGGDSTKAAPIFDKLLNVWWVSRLGSSAEDEASAVTELDELTRQAEESLKEGSGLGGKRYPSAGRRAAP